MYFGDILKHIMPLKENAFVKTFSVISQGETVTSGMKSSVAWKGKKSLIMSKI